MRLESVGDPSMVIRWWITKPLFKCRNANSFVQLRERV